MKVLGLDMSTKTGAAVVDSNKTVLHAETITFAKLRGMERAGAIAGRVLALHAQYAPDLVVTEGYGFASQSLATLVELATVTRYFLYQEGIPLLIVPPNSLKMFVLGKGSGAKELIMMNVLKRWGYEAKTNDEADAVGLALFGQAALRPHLFTAQDRKAVDKVTAGQPEVFAAFQHPRSLSQ